MRKYIDDILILTGCALVVYGSYLLNPVLVWFVSGAALIILGVLVGIGGLRR